MADSGTNTENTTLSVPKSDEEYFDMMAAAVNSGNTDEIDRLMSVQLTNESDDTTAEDTPAPEAGEAEPVATTEEAPTEPSVTTEAAPAADSRVTTQEPTTVDHSAEIQRLKSELGRVASLQSRFSQLERKYDQLSKQKETPAPKVESDLDKKIKDQITELRNIDPGTAELLEAMQAKMAADMEARIAASTPKYVEQVTEETHNRHLQEQLEIIVDQHPDFPEIVQDPTWHLWKTKVLTKEQRAWAESDRAEQVAAAVNAYKQYVSSFGQPQAVAAAPVAVVPVVDDKAKQARERKLQTSTTTKENTIKSGDTVDLDAMYSEMYAEAIKSSNIR